MVAAIRAAEARTTGEIRVFVTRRSVDDIMMDARRCFVELGMSGTRQWNAVLLFFAPATQQFAVLGDQGIAAVVGDSDWRQITDKIAVPLQAGRVTEGVEIGIAAVGDLLARHFPSDGQNANELPDRVGRD